MLFEVSIKNHRRLRPFLKRQEILKKEKRNKWKLWKATLNKPRWKFLSVEGSVDISYLELLKHIAIGGNWYVDRNFLFLQKNDWQNEEKYYEAYDKARSLKYQINRFRKIISTAFGMRDNMWSNNFIVNDRFVEKTEQGDLSTKIWQWITSYLASEIDNVFFSLPYDHVMRMLKLPTGGKKADLVAFIWDDQKHTPFPIVLEAKGRSDEDIAPNQIKEWEKQKNAHKKSLKAKYGIVSATCNLYHEDKSPKCLYVDPEVRSGYELTREDYGKLLNLYYAPLKTLIRTFEKKEIKEIEMKIHNGEKEEIKKQEFYIIKLKDIFDDIVYENISLYLRKEFLDFDDWRNSRSFMSEGAKIQEPNLYIDNDWIWFGIED